MDLNQDTVTAVAQADERSQLQFIPEPGREGLQAVVEFNRHQIDAIDQTVRLAMVVSKGALMLSVYIGSQYANVALLAEVLLPSSETVAQKLQTLASRLDAIEEQTVSNLVHLIKSYGKE